MPGGVAGDLSPEGNLGSYIDRALMPGHLWRVDWDPEGLLRIPPAIATTLFGVVPACVSRLVSGPAGKCPNSPPRVPAGLSEASCGAWCFRSTETCGPVPFAVFAAGVASLLVAACYWAIEVKGWRGWTKPFAILGSNALTLYVVSSLLQKTLHRLSVTSSDGASMSIARYVNVRYFAPFAAPETASALYAIASLVVPFVLLSWMYRRRIFLRP